MADEIVQGLPPGFVLPGQASAPTTIQQGAPAGRTPTTLPTLPPEGTKPFLNPPAHPVSEIRAPTWGDVFTPENILYKTLGIEPGSKRQPEQVVMKTAPLVINPTVQAAPRLATMGPGRKAVVSGLGNFLATGGDPVATGVGAAGGYLGGLVKNVFADPSKTTKVWTGVGEGIKQYPALAPAVEAMGGDARKLASWEGLNAIHQAARVPFNDAMRRIEAKVGKDTLIDLPLTTNQATELGLMRPEQLEKAMAAIMAAKVPGTADPHKMITGISGQQIGGVAGAFKPSATFADIRDKISSLRKGGRESQRMADILDGGLEQYLGTAAPGSLPLYQQTMKDYRRHMEVYRTVEALQDMRALPGGANRQDVEQAFARAVDKVAPPVNPRRVEGEAIAQNLAGVVMPRTAHGIAAGRGLRNILSQTHGMPPIQAPTAPQRVNLGKWLGAGASEIPAFINTQLPAEERPNIFDYRQLGRMP